MSLLRFTSVVEVLCTFGIAKDAAAIIAVMESEAKNASDTMSNALDTNDVSHIATVHNILGMPKILSLHFDSLAVMQWAHRLYDLRNATARESLRMLRHACSTGDLEMAKWLHSVHQYNIATISNAVIVACGDGHLNILQWMYDEFGAGLQSPDTISAIFQSKALLEACRYGHLHIVQWVIELFKPTGRDLQSAMAMAAACSGGQFDLARWLHTAHNVVIIGLEVVVALSKACTSGQIANAEWVLANFTLPLLPSEDMAEILCDICTTGDLEAAQWFVTKFSSFEYNKTNLDLIFGAACRSNTTIAQWVVSTFGQPTNGGIDQAIDYACCYGHQDMAVWLTKTYNKAVGNNCLVDVCRGGHIDMVRWIVETFPHIDHYGTDALIAAMSNDDMETAQYVRDNFNISKIQLLALPGVFLSLCGNGKLSMLQWAQETFNLKSSEILSSLGDMLYFACIHGHLDVAKWLQETFDIANQCIDIDKILQTTLRYDHTVVVWWIERTFGVSAKTE